MTAITFNPFQLQKQIKFPRPLISRLNSFHLQKKRNFSHKPWINCLFSFISFYGLLNHRPNSLLHILYFENRNSHPLLKDHCSFCPSFYSVFCISVLFSLTFPSFTIHINFRAADFLFRDLIGAQFIRH